MSIKTFAAKLFARQVYYTTQKWVNNPIETQKKIFHELITLAQETQFGKDHQFNKIKNFEIYRQSGLGREGEFNLYIGTDTFSKAQKMQFVNGLKAAIDAQNRMKKPNRDGDVSFDE